MYWYVVFASVLAVIFSISISAYLINYRMSINSKYIKVVLFLLCSIIIFVIVSSLIILLVWPPHVWDII